MAGESLQTRFAGHGLDPQRAPKQCPVNGVWRMLWGSTSRHGLLDTVKKHMVSRLEAQQRYFSYRAILVAIVSQNSFVLVVYGYRTIIARYVANGVSHRCPCVKISSKGGIAPFWGSANLL